MVFVLQLRDTSTYSMMNKRDDAQERHQTTGKKERKLRGVEGGMFRGISMKKKGKREDSVVLRVLTMNIAMGEE